MAAAVAAAAAFSYRGRNVAMKNVYFFAVQPCLQVARASLCIGRFSTCPTSAPAPTKTQDVEPPSRLPARCDLSDPSPPHPAVALSTTAYDPGADCRLFPRSSARPWTLSSSTRGRQSRRRYAAFVRWIFVTDGSGSDRRGTNQCCEVCRYCLRPARAIDHVATRRHEIPVRMDMTTKVYKSSR